MLLETMVRSFAPESRRASIRSLGLPLSPKPPTAMVAPSWMTSAIASAALDQIFAMTLLREATTTWSSRVKRTPNPVSKDGYMVVRPQGFDHIVDGMAVQGAQVVSRVSAVLRAVSES